MSLQPKEKRKAWLDALFSQLLWGTGGVSIKSVDPVLPGSFLVAIRHGIAAIVMGIAILTGKKKVFKKVPIWHLLALGILGAGLPDLFLVESIRRAGAIIPIMLARIEIPLGVLFAHIFLKEKVGKIAYVAAAASFGGAALITFPRGAASIDTSSDFYIGVLFGLAAAVVWGIASVYAKFMLSNKNVDPLVLSFVRMTTGSVFNFILVFSFVSGPLLILSKLSLFDWTVLLYLGIFLSGVAYLTFYKALQVLDAHVLMISLSVSMIINLMLGLALGETIVFMQYVGIALIGFSIFLIYNGTKK